MQNIFVYIFNDTKAKGFLLLLFLIVYFIAVNPPHLSFHSYGALSWQGKKDCVIGGEKSNEIGEANKISKVCVSEPFLPPTRHLEVGYKSTSGAMLKVLFEGSSDFLEFKLDPATEEYPRGFQLITLDSTPQTRIYLEVASNGSLSEGARIGVTTVRRRVDFYKDPKCDNRIVSAISNPVFQVFISLLIAVLLSDFLIRFSQTNHSGFVLFVFFALMAFFLHFRQAPYFWWDDWHVVERFFKQGFSGAWVSHNEHFIPLFFSVFFLQILLFGANYYLYLLVSLFFFAINGVLVFYILRRLLRLRKFEIPTSIIASTLYVTNSLQANLLQWTMVQCVIIAQTFIFLSCLCAFMYLDKKRVLFLILGAISFGISLFVFANSFSAILIIAMLLVFIILKHDENLERRAKILRAGTFLFVISAIMVVAFLVYANNKQGEGHVLNLSSIVVCWYKIIAYMFAGVEFGTVLRGVGLFPSHALSAADYISSLTSNAFYQITIYRKWPELCFGVVGFLFSLFLLGVYWRFRRINPDAIKLWCVGQCVMFSVFLLPGLGRYHFGFFQALSLRYQHAALFGLIIMLAPAIMLCVKVVREKQENYYLFKLVKGFLIVHLAIHLFLGTIPSHEVRNGIINREFIVKLDNWQLETQKAKDAKLLYGLYPEIPNKFTPARSAERIYEILSKLRLYTVSRD